MPSPNVDGSLSVLQLLNMDYGVSVLGGPLSVMFPEPLQGYSLHASIKYYVQGLLHHHEIPFILKKNNKYVYIIM